MKVYLAVTPPQVRPASRFTRALVHIAYRIGPDSTLLRQSLLVQTQGGLLGLTDREAPPVEDPEALTAAVLRECRRRSYSGAVLDWDQPVRGDLSSLARSLSAAARKNRLALYAPEAYAASAPAAVIPVCTALSGGNLIQRLRQAVSVRGAGRLALDLERLRMDFPLPCPSGEGRPLEAEAFSALMEREKPAVFFSADLCARYFTCVRDGQTHFVLFDDADTLAQKLRIGRALGAQAAFLQYPEVADLLERLFP